MIRIKEEIESYLLELNLQNYQSMLQQRIAAMSLTLSGLEDEEKRDDYQMDVI